LSRTLAGLLMPMALAKSLPSMAACLSVAPIFLPGVPFLFCPAVFSGSLGRGEAGIESQCHWSCGQASPGTEWLSVRGSEGVCVLVFWCSVSSRLTGRFQSYAGAASACVEAAAEGRGGARNNADSECISE
jgi:hypothetical protein